MYAIFLKELMDSRTLFWCMIANMGAALLLPTEFGQLWAVFLGYFIVPMFCCYMGSRILSADVSDEQLPFILTLPISRGQLWLARATAGGTLTVITSFCCIAMTFILFSSPYSPFELGLCAPILVAYLLAYAIAASLSVAFDRPLTAAFLAYTLGVLGTMVHIMALESRWSRNLGLWQYLTVTTTGVFIGVFALALLAGSFWVFRSADLLDRKDSTRCALRALAWAVFAVESAYWAWLLTR